MNARSTALLLVALMLWPAGAEPSARSGPGVELTFDGPFPADFEQTAQLKVSAGGLETRFYMLLTNRGETADTFDLYSEGAPIGWAASLNVTVVSLPAFETRPVGLSVLAPENLSGGLQSWALVTAAARSRSDPTCTTHLHTLTVLDTAEGPAMVGFTGPGQTASMAFRVGNTGAGADNVTVGAAYVHSEPRLDIHQPWETHAPGGWQYSVSPPAIEILGGGQAPARLEVTAPSDAARGDYQILNITARSSRDPSKTSRLTAITIVSVRYGVRLECAEPLKKTFGGQPARFAINVTNTGTMRDVVSLSAGPPPAGWTASLGAASLVLNSGDTRQVELAVTPSITAPSNWTATVRVSGVSAGNLSQTGWVDTFTLANPDRLLRFNGTRSVLYVDPGNATTHILEVRNLGTADDLAMLELSGVPGNWTAVLGASSLPIYAGASGFVSVMVTAPAEALAGEMADLLVRCRSPADPADVSDIQVRTIANRTVSLSAELSPASRPAEPGEGVPFILTVQNGGNADEEVRLLGGRLPENWTVEFNVSALAVGPRSSNRAQCTVTPDSLAFAGDHPFSVYARSLPAGAEACATVSVREVFRFELECASSEKEVLPGGLATYEVTAVSRGNTGGTVLFGLVDESGSPDLVWAAGAGSVLLPAGGRAAVMVDLTAAADAPGGLRGRCRLRGIDAGNSSFFREVSLGGTVAVESGLGLTREPESAGAMPGKKAVFNLTVRNLGNVGEDLGFGLAGLPSGWAFDLRDPGGREVSSFSLAPHAGASFLLTLTTAPGAPAGNHTVWANFTTASGQSISALCRVRVGQVYDLSLSASQGSVTVRAGGACKVGLEVRNLGNGPDAVVLWLLGGGGEKWAGLDNASLLLEAGRAGDSALELRPQRGEPDGVHRFDLRVRSSSGLERNLTIEVRVVQDEDLETSEPPCMLAGALVLIIGVAAAAAIWWRGRRHSGRPPSP